MSTEAHGQGRGEGYGARGKAPAPAATKAARPTEALSPCPARATATRRKQAGFQARPSAKRRGRPAAPGRQTAGREGGAVPTQRHGSRPARPTTAIASTPACRASKPYGTDERRRGRRFYTGTACAGAGGKATTAGLREGSATTSRRPT